MASILVFVSTIIARDTGEVLFVREAKQVHRGQWNLPGGHLEFGESLFKAAVREVMEETQLSVMIEAFQGVYIGRRPEMHSMRYVFHGIMEDEEAQPVAGDEILELKWASPTKMILLPDEELVGAPYFRAIMRDYIEGRAEPLFFNTIHEIDYK